MMTAGGATSKRDAMPNMVGDKSLTFGLDGEVRLAELARALQQFSHIARALAEEVDQKSARAWTITGLRPGSAFATASNDVISDESFNVVSERYLVLADELQKRNLVSFRDSIARPARVLLGLVSDRIPDLVFETARDTKVVSGENALPEHRTVTSAIGTLQGRVQTLSSRHALRFTLYEPVFDRAVNCYITEEAQEQLRGAWDKWAAVEGTISRNPLTGAPLAIRDIQRIAVVQTSMPGSYRVARGAMSPGTESPEGVIRRYRDG